MALQKLVFRPTDRHRDLRLDQFLARALTATEEGISRRRARRLIAAGAVYLDGRRTRIASRRLEPGFRVEVYLDRGRPEKPRRSSEIDVGNLLLYEDEHLIAVDKPAGVNSQATVDDDVHHLFAAVRRYLAEREATARPYLALHHRLDRGTSGVQLLSKSRAANAGLAAAFRERQVRKLYLALAAVEGPPPADEWTVRDRLVLRRQGPHGVRRAISVATGGRPAETRFRVRERLAGAALVEAVPKTGRTHQIRVHLAGSGMAVAGDRLYGPSPPPIRASRLMLHAAVLELEHPLRRETVRVESPLPEDFERLLRSLSA